MAEERPIHRSRSRIFADILRAIEASDNVRITYILHAANVPHDRLQKYLGQMERSRLIEKASNGEGAVYVITQKGQRYLVEFKKLEEFSIIFGVEL